MTTLFHGPTALTPWMEDWVANSLLDPKQSETAPTRLCQLIQLQGVWCISDGKCSMQFNAVVQNMDSTSAVIRLDDYRLSGYTVIGSAFTIVGGYGMPLPRTIPVQDSIGVRRARGLMGLHVYTSDGKRVAYTVTNIDQQQQVLVNVLNAYHDEGLQMPEKKVWDPKTGNTEQSEATVRVQPLQELLSSDEEEERPLTQVGDSQSTQTLSQPSQGSNAAGSQPSGGSDTQVSSQSLITQASQRSSQSTQSPARNSFSRATLAASQSPIASPLASQVRQDDDDDDFDPAALFAQHRPAPSSSSSLFQHWKNLSSQESSMVRSRYG